MTFRFDERRRRALEAFAGGVAVIPSARMLLRSGDTEHAYRQHSDLYYLCGFEEPDAVLVLAPHHEHRSVLFLRKRDRTQELWNGERLGVERAIERLGVDAAYPIDELAERLPEYLSGASTLHYAVSSDEAFDRRIFAALESARARTRRKGRAPEAIVDPGSVLHQMRLLKDAAEIEAMRRAADVTRDGHLAAMHATKPGIYEYEIKAMLEYAYARAGGQPAYQSIVASGDNATVLHYVRARDRLETGTLLLVDSACELDYYATDVTRTWPVDGRFSAEQRAIYEIVLAAQEAAIGAVRPGTPRTAFHDAALRTIVEGLLDLGLLRGSVDENVESEGYKAYYMHGTGHWIGLDVHDVGRYRHDDDSALLLQPGMVTTVEPGIYVHRDAECAPRFKGIGVRIEDDVLVTASGNENLTAAIPKSVDAIEEAVGLLARIYA
ncbi:MAG TPA: aminopeptidase P N-terminal domain-containing protein [Verrucomicrobiae bacterium]|nr:aminopeptidase P N-terminal domain-containing protein [Verrucomicrobiae bacterium]